MADVDRVSDDDLQQASEKNLNKMRKFAENFANKSGTYLHPEPDITEFLVIGLAQAHRRLRSPALPLQLLRGQGRRGQGIDLDLPLRGDAALEILPLTALLR